MPNVVPTFGRREQRQRDRDQLDHLVKIPWPDGAQKRFEFREDLLDRIEIRTVRRQKSEVRPGPFDGRANLGLFVDSEVVEDHDIPGPQRRRQHLFHVRAKARAVDRPIEDGGRCERVGAQGRDDGMRLPMTAGGVVVEARAARTASISTQQVRRDAALVHKHIARGIVQRQPVSPLPALRRHVSAALFVRVYGFF